MNDDGLKLTRSSWTGLRRLEAEFLRPYRAVVLLSLIGMLAQSALSLPVPLLQGWVVDQLVRSSDRGSRIAESKPEGPAATYASPGEAGQTMSVAPPLARVSSPAVPESESLNPQSAIRNPQSAIVLSLAAMIACHLARMVLGWKVSAVMSRVALEMVRELTDALHRKIQRLPMAYFERQQTGRILARVTGDVGSLLIFLNAGSLQLASDLVLAAGISAVLVWLRWDLALAGLVAVPLYAANHRWFAEKILDLSRGLRAEGAAIYALLSERVSAVRVVRSFAKEDAEVAELDRRIDAHRAVGWAGMRAGAWQGALATAISGLGTLFVVVYGAILVGRGRLSVGELLAFYALIAQLYNPIVRLTGFQPMMAATLVAVDRLVEVLDEPETVADRPGARPIRRAEGALSFRSVSFTYPAGERPVLDRIDLVIEPGETVGLLGASGSGKSTLLALAPRMYDLPEGRGSILLDGRAVREYRLADLRRAVALVPQQAMLFEGTIRSNLTYARPDASAEAVRRALEAADLAALVNSLPMGLDTPVGERGQTLSGGQRQRLALARALVADPAVLLLDDCTSALDAETEARIQAALEDLLPGRTCVIVSHKVSSVRRADRIVVLDAGRIAEQGTHEVLLRLDGLYAETYRRQTGALVLC